MDEFLAVTDGKVYIHINRPDAFALHEYMMNAKNEPEWRQITYTLYLYAHRLFADSQYTLTTEQIKTLQGFYEIVQKAAKK